MLKTPEIELAGRAEGLRGLMGKRGIDCALICQNADRYYLAGTVQDGVLLLAAEGAGAGPVLFVRRTLGRAREESLLRTILPMGSLEDVCAYIKDTGLAAATIGLEMDVLPARFYLNFASLFPGARFVDIGAAIRKLRSVKSPWEISLMKEAGRRLDRAFTRIREEIRPGRSEREVFIRLLGFLLDEGSGTVPRTRAFNMEVMPPYVLSGESAAKASIMDSPSGGGEGLSTAFPYGAGDKRLVKGEPIMIDTSLTHEGYVSDCARIFSIGPLDDGFTRAHAVSDECHRLFAEGAREGAYIPELCKRIEALVEKRGLGESFMGGVKFIGHGVGLELDELPLIAGRYEDTLREGMVVAFEPKFVFPGGTVGYENTYCLQRGVLVGFHGTATDIQYV